MISASCVAGLATRKNGLPPLLYTLFQSEGQTLGVIHFLTSDFLSAEPRKNRVFTLIFRAVLSAFFALQKMRYFLLEH
jgi:hypothetical protein